MSRLTADLPKRRRHDWRLSLIVNGAYGFRGVNGGTIDRGQAPRAVVAWIGALVAAALGVRALSAA